MSPYPNPPPLPTTIPSGANSKPETGSLNSSGSVPTPSPTRKQRRLEERAVDMRERLVRRQEREGRGEEKRRYQLSMRKQVVARLKLKLEEKKCKLAAPPTLVSHPTPVRSNPLKDLIRLYPYQKRWIEDKARFRISCKGRQIGMSLVVTLEGALVARATHRHQIYLSRGERQSKILAEKATTIIKSLDIATSPVKESEWVYEDNPKIRCLQLEIQFPNGVKMYFLPAKPETARSYSGDVYLDEFAFHADAAKIYAALYPTITRGYRISIVSTPNGQIGKYYEFAKSAGLVPGYERDSYSPWSPHLTDVYLAVMEGLADQHIPDPSMRIHPDVEEEVQEGFRRRSMNPSPRQFRFVCELRAGAEDQDTWLQEFECQFLSSSQNYIPIELILEAERDDIGTESLPDHPFGGRMFMGIDVGRKVHRTVFWIQEEVEDLLVTRAVTVLAKAPFQDQAKIAHEYMSKLGVYKCCVDATGMGAQIAENLEKSYPGRVEPIQFTLQSKDIMATLMKRTFEEHRYRIPASPIIRGDINGIKRGVTRAGNLVFSAEETKEGHSDRAWALALSTLAAQQPVAAPISIDNFVGLNRQRPPRVPDVPGWESHDLSSIWGPGIYGRGGRVM